jgi:hypothetical protein
MKKAGIAVLGLILASSVSFADGVGNSGIQGPANRIEVSLTANEIVDAPVINGYDIDRRRFACDHGGLSEIRKGDMVLKPGETIMVSQPQLNLGAGITEFYVKWTCSSGSMTKDLADTISSGSVSSESSQ